MDSKERVLKAVTKGGPDRLPIFCGRIDDFPYWAEHFGVKTEKELRELWGLDCQKMEYSKAFRKKKGKTIWGADDDYDIGYSSVKKAPLQDAETVADVEAHNWPDASIVDFEEITRQMDALDADHARIGTIGFTAPFCMLCDLFGMEEAMMNMHAQPELMDAALAQMQHFILETMRRVLDENADKMDFFWLGDDFSTQRGMMIAPEMWRRFLKPLYMKMFELVKSYGLMVWFHSCGSFAPVIGELVDGGMDVWETVQAHLEGNEPAELKRRFGKNLTFFGAVSSQGVLPFGTPEDVRKEVRERFRVLGDGGGYICGPDHSVQQNMPWQNVEALFDEAKKCLY